MATDSTSTFPVADRWSYLWLVLGGILGLFSFGQWAISMAPWLSILFFIRFIHSQTPFRGYVILSLAGMVPPAVHLFWLELVPPSMFPAHILYVIIIFGSLMGSLVYLADRLIAPRLKGLAATLIFPVTFTAWEFVTLANNPMGTFGALAYTQYGNLPLMQLVSVTGLSGLTFLIAWFGATGNWIWERSFSWPAIRRCVALYGVVMGLVLLYGGARLVFHNSPTGSMHVASFTSVDFREVRAGDLKVTREKTRDFHKRYFDETRRQADAGAELVLWPEGAGFCWGEDEAALIEQGRQLAREKNIYLVMPLFTQHKQRNRPMENKLVLNQAYSVRYFFMGA